ncbi:hypothetical protein PoB_005667600 [Plakobranchus ocellatus]|uniref:Uncharacterized protein n=1 Tax=Plakobranchus ocellatus TaxID=259542 RepID=A0AAV4CBQ9_9GAST|nr:hypothetical protein PoB_005667600 [Plakobranchus ocellatus]
MARPRASVKQGIASGAQTPDEKVRANHRARSLANLPTKPPWVKQIIIRGNRRILVRPYKSEAILRHCASVLYLRTQVFVGRLTSATCLCEGG